MNITINTIELASELAAYELQEYWQNSIQIFDIEDEEENNEKIEEKDENIFNVDKYFEKCVMLPLNLFISKEEANYVANLIFDFYGSSN